MCASKLRLLFPVAVIVSLAGCGGSSNSGPTGGGNPTVVTYNFTSSLGSVMPVAVATQIGTGAYTAATLTSGKLTISIPNGESNFSVAFLCPSPAGNTTPQNIEIIRQESILDGTSYSTPCFQPSNAQTGTATLQVNAAAIPGAAWVSGGYGEMPWSGSTVDFSMPLKVGTYDIPVSASKNELFFDNYLAIRILRAQTVPGALNGGAPVVFTANDEVQPQTITYGNTPAGFSINSPLVFYQTSGGAQILLDQEGPTGQYLAIPSGTVQSGDTYFFTVGASANQIANGASYPVVGIERYTPTGGTQSFNFPTPWIYAGPAPATLPSFNFAYSDFSGSSNVSDIVNLEWYPASGAINEISMSSTANYRNGSTAMAIPDLSSLTGFLIPPASGAVNWNAEIVQGNFTSTNPPSGNIEFVGNNGTYTLP